MPARPALRFGLKHSWAKLRGRSRPRPTESWCVRSVMTAWYSTRSMVTESDRSPSTVAVLPNRSSKVTVQVVGDGDGGSAVVALVGGGVQDRLRMVEHHVPGDAIACSMSRSIRASRTTRTGSRRADVGTSPVEVAFPQDPGVAVRVGDLGEREGVPAFRGAGRRPSRTNPCVGRGRRHAAPGGASEFAGWWWLQPPPGRARGPARLRAWRAGPWR